MLLLCLLATLGNQGLGAATPPRIAAIEIEGARRTRRETVLLLARVRAGEPWREGLDVEVRQNLLNAGIFYEVAVAPEPAGDDVRLRISLREKWSLIPIPLFIVKDGEKTWGGTLIESNLFGTASLLFVFLSVTEGEPGGSLTFIDPHLAGTRFQLFGSFRHTDQRRDIWDASAKTGSYRCRTTGGILALGYRFAPRTSLSLGVQLTDFSFGNPLQNAATPADARERAVALQLRHEGTDLEEERQRGFSAEARLERGFSGLGDEVGRTEARAGTRWTRGTAGGRTLSLHGHALWTDNVAYAAGFRPPTWFLRGYETDRFRPDRLLGGTLEYQLPVSRYRQTVISLVPFADAALLRDRFRRFTPADVQADAGVAIAVYLRRVALPVLQIYGAYGFSSGRVLPGFALGVAF